MDIENNEFKIKRLPAMFGNIMLTYLLNPEGKMKKLIFAFILVAFSNLVKAECSPNACIDVYVDRLYVNSSGTVYVGTSGDENLLDCSAESGVYTTLNLGEPGANAIYSTLLSAQMANKKIQVRTANGSTGCSILYVTLDKQ